MAEARALQQPEDYPTPARSAHLLRVVRARAQRPPEVDALYARALVLWPGLERRQLSRTRGDVHRIARLVARRTSLSEESIVRLLGG